MQFGKLVMSAELEIANASGGGSKPSAWRDCSHPRPACCCVLEQTHHHYSCLLPSHRRVEKHCVRGSIARGRHIIT